MNTSKTLRAARLYTNNVYCNAPLFLQSRPGSLCIRCFSRIASCISVSHDSEILTTRPSLKTSQYYSTPISASAPSTNRSPRSNRVLDAKSRGSIQQRGLSTSQAHHKKSSASSKSTRQSPEIKVHQPSQQIPDNKSTQSKDREIDPYDYTELESGIAKAVARLKDALTKTRDAGRVSTEMIESLPVEVNVKGNDAKGGSAHKEKNKIGDIASVVPKGGRTMQVFCAEEAHVKPISSAIQASPHSLVPQPDQQNPLLLIIPVPPATAETRQQAAAEAKKVMEKASTEVRNARGEAQKRFRKMELQKLVIVDELRKAHKGMEDVVKKGQDEVKKVYEGALKALER